MNLSFKGFSLVEIMIGTLIFAVMGTAFVIGLQMTKKEIEFGADHFSAILLTQKLMEELSQEIFMNPYGFSGIEGKNIPPVKIVDGGSPYFSFMEDKLPPWFFIDPASDGRIDSNQQPLYSQIKDFNVSIQAQRMGPPTDATENKCLYSVSGNLSWKPKTGAGGYTISCRFPSVIYGKKVSFPYPFSDTEVEKETCAHFFDSSKSLSAHLSEKGGDYQTLMELGKIHLLTKTYWESAGFSSTTAEISNLEARYKSMVNSPSPELASCCLNLAQSNYELAKQSFRLIAILEPSLKVAFKNFDQTHLGTPLWNSKIRIFPVFSKVKLIGENLTSALFWARTNYENLLDPNVAFNVDSRQQNQIILRLIDLYKILSVDALYPDGKKEYRKFLERVKAFSEGRNPFLFRAALQEVDWANDEAELLRRYPNLKQVYGILGEELPKIIDFVKVNDIK